MAQLTGEGATRPFRKEGAALRILQYSYFALRSESISAEGIAAQLHMQPDEAINRGPRSGPHSYPRRHHVWRIVERTAEPVDEQLRRIVGRLNPIRNELIAFVRDEPVEATMQVVRYFNDPDGEEDDAPATGADGLTRLGGQHQLLGWNLDSAVLAFLRSVSADLDVDEYDTSEA